MAEDRSTHDTLQGASEGRTQFGDLAHWKSDENNMKYGKVYLAAYVEFESVYTGKASTV